MLTDATIASSLDIELLTAEMREDVGYVRENTIHPYVPAVTDQIPIVPKEENQATPRTTQSEMHQTYLIKV